MTVAPQVDICAYIRKSRDIVGDVVDFWRFEWTVPGIPMGARVGSGTVFARGVDLRLCRRHRREASGGLPFVALEDDE